MCVCVCVCVREREREKLIMHANCTFMCSDFQKLKRGLQYETEVALRDANKKKNRYRDMVACNV